MIVGYLDQYQRAQMITQANGYNFNVPIAVGGYTALDSPAMIHTANTTLMGVYASTSHQLVATEFLSAGYFDYGTSYPGILMAASPAILHDPLTNDLVITFQSNDRYNVLFQSINSSQQETGFVSPANKYANIRIGSAPSMARAPGGQFAQQGYLFLTFKSNDKYNLLFKTQAQ